MDYTITEVAPTTNDWENTHGKYRSYMVRFQGHEGQVEIARKKQPDGEVKYVPKVGDKLTGAINTKENGMQKFKQDYSAGAGSYNSAPSTGGSDSPSPEYWASKDKRISRQHSQEMALRYAAVKGKADVTFEEIQKLADAFDNDLPELLDE